MMKYAKNWILPSALIEDCNVAVYFNADAPPVFCKYTHSTKTFESGYPSIDTAIQNTISKILVMPIQFPCQDYGVLITMLHKGTKINATIASTRDEFEVIALKSPSGYSYVLQSPDRRFTLEYDSDFPDTTAEQQFKIWARVNNLIWKCV